MFLTIKLCTHAELIIYIKMDLALKNLQRLICHKTHQTKPNLNVDARQATSATQPTEDCKKQENYERALSSQYFK